MKTACITDDGRTISQHFGRAPCSVVYAVEDGHVVSREMRNKLGHQQFQAEERADEEDGHHGTSAASHDKHVEMAQVISDCEVLLCRGMGSGAYQSMLRLGIQPTVTEVGDLEAPVQSYIGGCPEDHPERLH